MPDRRYDLAIVGGGLAGMTAGLYASRAGLDTVLLERLMTGGQIINAHLIENFPGFPDGISGADLAALVQDQATRFGLDLQLDEVTGLRRNGPDWTVETYDGEIEARAVVIAGGSTLRRLGVPGEAEMHGAGVSYCATCDGAFFRDQVVGVVGGGDSALDEAMVLTEVASKVIIFHRDGSFSGQQVLRDQVTASPKVEVRFNTVVDAVLGDSGVEGVAVTEVTSGETSRVDLQALFIYVGLEPNTDYLRGLLPLDNAGHVETDIWMRTPLPGLFAAGDIRQHSAAQLVSSAGDGATAAIAARRYLDGQPWPDSPALSG